MQKKTEKLHHLEYRLNRALGKMNSVLCKRHKQTSLQKEIEMEVAHLNREIQQYGFKFFPDHYVRENVMKIESLVTEL